MLEVHTETLERIRMIYHHSLSREFVRELGTRPDRLEVSMLYAAESDIYAIRSSWDFWGKPANHQVIEYLEYPKNLWHYFLQWFWPERYRKKMVHQITIQTFYPSISFGGQEHEPVYPVRHLRSLDSVPSYKRGDK